MKRFALGLACALAGAALYLLPNRFGGAPILLPLTAIDRAIPFWPASVWAYAAIYVLLLGAYFGANADARASVLLRQLLFTQAIAAVVYVALPIGFPRDAYPIASDTLTINRWMAELWRRIDAPVNCLPSLHVTTAMLCLSVFDEGRLRPWRPFALALAVLTVASTLTFKQHYVVDLLAGGVLARLALALFPVSPRTRPGAAPLLPARSRAAHCARPTQAHPDDARAARHRR